MRIGSSRLTVPDLPTVAHKIQALCSIAMHHHHGTVRIPHTYITPIDAHALTVIHQIIHTACLRIIVHAPIAPISMLADELVRYSEFLTQLNATDGVIICHMPTVSDGEWYAIAHLDAPIRQHLAIELTHQPIDVLIPHATAHQIPIVFDWLHYHIQAPWPYHPVTAAVQCRATWGHRRPLIHLSSPDTAAHIHQPHSTGRHSAFLDWATHMYFVGQYADLVTSAFDVEIEATAGHAAVTHFLKQCRHYTPPQWYELWLTAS